MDSSWIHPFWGEILSFTPSGNSRIMSVRKPVMLNRMKMQPATKTAAKAAWYGKPLPKQMVKVKKALVPMPVHVYPGLMAPPSIVIVQSVRSTGLGFISFIDEWTTCILQKIRSWCQHEGVVWQDAHQPATAEGCQCSGTHQFFTFARDDQTQHPTIHWENISHCQECCDSRTDLCDMGGSSFLDVKRIR